MKTFATITAALLLLAGSATAEGTIVPENGNQLLKGCRLATRPAYLRPVRALFVQSIRYSADILRWRSEKS
jgi:hypothetical protein